MTEQVKVIPSVFRQQVENGMKKAELAAYYNLPETNIAQILKQLNLTIKKNQTPKYVLVEEEVLETTNLDLEQPEQTTI